MSGNQSPELREEDYISSESEEEDLQPLRSSYSLDPENASKYQGKSILEKELEFQLKKRIRIIDELRRAYLRDVVAVKYVMNEVLEESERRRVLDDLNDSVPSVNLKEPLLLRSPYHGALTIKPCKTCGGSLEVVFSDVQKVKDLQSKVDALVNRNDLMRLMVATLEANLEKVTSEAAEESKSHSEEKRYLYTEIRRLKAEMEESAEKSRRIAEANKKMREENLKHISNHQDLTIRSLANEKALERALEMNTEMKQTIADLRVEIHAFETGNMDLEAKIASLGDRLKIKDEDILKRSAMIEELQRDISELKVQIEKQREFSKNAENAADIADRAKQSLLEENRKLQVVMEKQLQLNEVLEDKVTSLREELRDTIADLDASRTVLSTVQVERDVQKALVEEVQKRLEQKDSEVNRLTIQLKDLERHKDEEISQINEAFAEREANFLSKEALYLRELNSSNSFIASNEENFENSASMGKFAERSIHERKLTEKAFNVNAEHEFLPEMEMGGAFEQPEGISLNSPSNKDIHAGRRTYQAFKTGRSGAAVGDMGSEEMISSDAISGSIVGFYADDSQSIPEQAKETTIGEINVRSKKVIKSDEVISPADSTPASLSPKKRYNPTTRKSIVRTQDKKPYRKMEHVICHRNHILYNCGIGCIV